MTSLTTNLGLEKIVGADTAGKIREAINQHADKLELQRPFVCQVSRAASQTAAAPFVVSWDTEDFDPNAMHEGVTHPTRVTIPAGGAGLYVVVASIILAPSPGATDDLSVDIAVNGVTYAPRGHDTDKAVTRMDTTIKALLGLDVGDYLEVDVSRATGSSNIAVTVAALDVVRVSPMIAGGYPGLP